MKVRVYEVHATYEVEVPGVDCSEPVLREAVAKVKSGVVAPLLTTRTHVAVPLSVHLADARDVLRALCSVLPAQRLAAVQKVGLNLPPEVDEGTWVVNVVTTAAAMGRLGALFEALRSVAGPESPVWG